MKHANKKKELNCVLKLLTYIPWHTKDTSLVYIYFPQIPLTLLHSEQPKLHRVLVVLSAVVLSGIFSIARDICDPFLTACWSFCICLIHVYNSLVEHTFDSLLKTLLTGIYLIRKMELGFPI